MKSIQLKNNFGKLLLAFSFLFGIGIMTSQTAQAQWQNDPWGNNQSQRDRERERRRREREREREARRNGTYNNGAYNNGTYGNGGYNNGAYGNGTYGRRGRNADGYGNYGGSYDLRQTALNAGFADGVKEGRRDRQRNERYDFTDESDFQKGTRDYSSRLGDRGIYMRYYREAFSHGYADGYGGY